MADKDGENSQEENELLQTIKVPLNLAHLSSRLPKSNYARKRDENKLKQEIAKKLEKHSTTRQPSNVNTKALEDTGKFTSQPNISATPSQTLEKHLDPGSKRNQPNLRSMNLMLKKQDNRNAKSKAQITADNADQPSIVYDRASRQSSIRGSQIVTVE